MTFIDLFSGIGGFRLGMELAGHQCLGHCEIDNYANVSYNMMHDVKEGEWFESDINSIDPRNVPDCDCRCFGFPCQDISVAGKQTGFAGKRSSLFFAVTRLLREKENKPNYLFIENVKNFFSVNGGWDFLSALAELDEIGYDVEWQLLNSKHFGVPQNRERVFIIGHLRCRCTRKVFPITGIIGKALKQIIGNMQTTTQVEVRSVLTPDRAEKRQNGRRIKDDGEDMFTLTSQDRHGVMLGSRIRRLTPRECFRLQGFPDEYFDRASSVTSDSQLYKQAGNSVTVNVIYEIAKKLEVIA